MAITKAQRLNFEMEREIGVDPIYRNRRSENSANRDEWLSLKKAWLAQHAT